MKLSLMVSIGLFLAGAAVGPTSAHGEAQGPVGNAMHKMQTALMCLQHRLPANICRGDQIAAFRVGAADGRTAMLATQPGNEAVEAQINGFFDRVDAGVDHMAAAVEGGQQADIQTVVNELEGVMSEAHRIFRHSHH